MNDSTEWANVQGGEQMELATVVVHDKRTIQEKFDTGIELMKRYPPYPIDETSRSKVEALVGKDNPCLRVEPAHIPPVIRLAKLLRQYDESPSSALWSEIQSVAREILR